MTLLALTDDACAKAELKRLGADHFLPGSLRVEYSGTLRDLAAELTQLVANGSTVTLIEVADCMPVTGSRTSD